MLATRVTANHLRRFSPPPGLARSAPRDVRLNGGGRVLVALAWLLTIGAIAAAVLMHREAWQQWDAARALEQRGAIATAVVDRVWRKSGDGKPAFAAFHFDAAGTRVAGETRMELPAWRGLRAGSTVTVRYLPQNPQRWMLDGARIRRLPFWAAYLVPAALALIALLLAAVVRRQRSLLAEGRVVPAVVAAVRKQHGADGASHRAMTYEFPLLGGGVGTGKAAAPKDVHVGATICVVYHPDRPSRNQPFPFSLVTPDACDR
jgi:hypothetical protein